MSLHILGLTVSDRGRLPYGLSILTLSFVSMLGCSISTVEATAGAGGAAGTAGSGGAAGTAANGGAAGTAASGAASDSCGASTETYTASGTDESAVVVDGSSQTVENAAITSDSVTSSQDESSFHGLNAAVLVENGGTLTMTCSTVTTTGAGANGVFSTGASSTVKLTHVTIECSAEGGHGVDATEGGTLTLTDVDITTSGSHGAALATDRGGGTVSATGGRVVTSGVDSPGIYSTGDIDVSGATIAAKGAEAVVIEGANTVTLTDTKLSAATGSRDRGLMIYQSMSGDAEGTTGTFDMSGGSFAWSSTTGPLFYVTNSTGSIHLTNVTLTSASTTLLKAGADQWGTSGNNGGNGILIADQQQLTGDFVADSLSSLDITLRNSTSLTGAVNAAGTAKAVALSLDDTSSWTLGADCVVTTLTDAQSDLSNIVGNGHTICYTSALNGASTATSSLSGGGSVAPCE